MRIPLTRYGFREIVSGCVFCAVAVALSLLFFWPAAPLFGILWIWVLAFFRDPEREAPVVPDALISPADGTVRDVEAVEPPGDFLSGPAMRIGIFMSLFNVHVNRSPAAGTVSYVGHFPGRLHDARNPLAASENEHNLLGIELPDGRRILVNQVAGTIARRIVCEATPGQDLAAGQRFGMIKFGSRVELFVPQAHQFQLKVAPGDKVRAGRDIVGTYRP